MERIPYQSIKHLGILFFLLAGLCFTPLARAADISATDLPDVNSFIGEQSCMTSILSNTGTPGFGPYLIVSVTENAVFDSASLLGLSLTKTLLGVIDNDPLTPPVTDPISGTEFTTPLNASVYQLILPIGSVVENGPQLDLEICTSLLNGIALGDIQTVSLTPGYQFGDTPTGVNGPIFDYPAKQVSGDIIPVVEILQKTSTAPEGKRPPGPSFPFEYHLSSDIANGETLTDITLLDTLDSTLQWTGDPILVNASNAVNCVVVDTPNSAPLPGGDVKVHCDSVTGSLADSDLQVIIPVYITDILDESANNPQQTISNHTDMDYTYDSVGYVDAGDVDVLAKPFTLQKEGSPRRVLPGENVAYTLKFQYTDYPLTGNKIVILAITDILPDGLRFNPGSAKLIVNGVDLGVINPTVTPGPGAGETTLVWDVQTTQGLANGSTARIDFIALVGNSYHDSKPILSGDDLINTASASWELVNGGTGIDNSSDIVSIFNATLTKSIFSPDPLPAFLKPGDPVIFHLTQFVPPGNIGSLFTVDFLPLPVFDVTTFDIINDWDVTSTTPIPTPQVFVNVPTNSIHFDFGDLNQPLALLITTELRLTIVDTPFADELSLANIAITSFINSEGDSSLLSDAVQIKVAAPSLDIYKGVLTTDNPGANISPAPPNSTQSPVIGDVSGVDGSDVIDFMITVENTGKAPAYQVTVTDPAVSGLSSCVTSQVENGAGTALTFTTVTDGIRLDAALTATDGTPGQSFSTDTALIIMQCTVDPLVGYAQQIINSAHVVWAGTDTASTFFPQKTATAKITTASPVIKKTVIDIQPGYTSMSPYKNISQRGVSIGERVTWQVEITLPEGQMKNVNFQDRLNSGLAFVDTSLVITPGSAIETTVAPGGNDFSGVLANADYLNVGNTERGVDQRLTIGPGLNDFGLGTISNTDKDNNTPETLVFTYHTIVLNWASNKQDVRRKNSARLFWDKPDASGRAKLIRNGPTVRIQEPKITVKKALSINTGDAGDVFQVSLQVEQTATNAPAFQFKLEDQIPTGLDFNGNLAVGACTVPPDTLLENAGLVTADWDEFPTGASCALTFDVIVANNVGAGTVIENCAETFWQSLNDSDQTYAMGSNPLAAERTGDITDQGTIANTYTSESCADFKILDVGIAKTVIATSQSHTGTNQHQAGVTDLTIGEEVTYQIIATLPEGNLSQLIVTDTVPSGIAVLELLTATVTQVGSNITLPSGIPTALISDAHLSDGINDTAVFDFGANITDDVNNQPQNNDDRIFIEVTARVKNLAVNVDGNPANNTVLVQFGPGLDGGARAPADLVEPQLLVHKNVDHTTSEAGQPLLYSILLKHAPGSTADAFFVNLQDALPAGLNFINFVRGDCLALPDVGPLETAGVITASWDSFPLNASCEIKFVAELDISVTTGQQITNKVDAKWSSLDKIALPDNRTYSDNAEITVVVSDPGVFKDLFATNNVDTSNGEKGSSEDLTIGETIVYKIVVSFEDGTALDVRVRDLLPTNQAILEYVDSSVISIGKDLIIKGLAVGDPGDDCLLTSCDHNNDGLRDVAEWDLGKVINKIDAIVGPNPDDELVLHVTAIVADVPKNNGIPGQSINQSNLAEVHVQGKVFSSLYNIDIVEPLLKLKKTALPNNGQIVDGSSPNIVYEIVISHIPDSTADAYDLLITDLINPNTFWVNDTTVTSDCPGFSLGRAPAVGDTGPVEFKISQLAKSAGQCTISYTLDINNALPVEGQFINLAELEWFSMPPTGSNPDPSGRKGDEISAGLFISIADAGLTKEVVSTTLKDTDRGMGTDLGDASRYDLAIGELALYEVVMSFNEGTTDNVVLTDNIQFDPALGKMEILAATVVSLGADITTSLPGTVVGAPGDIISLNFGTVTNGADVPSAQNDTITVQIAGRMLDLPENINDINAENQAELQFETALTREDFTQVNTVLPDLTMTKTMQAPVNNIIEIVLQLENTGTAPAYDLVIKDPFDEAVYTALSATAVATPPGFAFSQTSNAGETIVEFKQTGDPLLPSADQVLLPGESMELRFSITVSGGHAPVSTHLINKATTDYSTLPGAIPGERLLDIDANADLKLPSLSQAKIWSGANNPALPGDQLSYTITINNTGESDAHDVVVTDTPDPLGTFIAGSVIPSAGGVVVTGNVPGDTSVKVEFPELIVGSSATISYHVDINNPWPIEPQKLTNQADVDSIELTAGVTDWPVDSGATDPTIAIIVADPVLQLTKSDGGATAIPGQALVYELAYANTGNQNTAGVILTETVPLYTTFNAVNSLPTIWTCADGATPGTTCQATIGNLDVNNPGTAFFALQVDSTIPANIDMINNSASITDDGQQSDNGLPVTARDSDDTPINAALSLAVNKSDGGISTFPGSVYAYELAYSNAGNQDLTGVVLTETVPPYTFFNAAASTPGWSCADGSPAGTVCRYAIGGLAAADSASVNFALLVMSPLLSGVELTANTVAIQDDGHNSSGVILTDQGSDATPIIAVPDLSIVKDDGGASNIQPGDIIHYNIQWALMGDQNTENVVVTEVVPDGTRFSAGNSTPSVWSCPDASLAGTVCTVNLGSVVVGSIGQLTFAVQVDNPLPTGMNEAVNTVSITDGGINGADPTPANNISTVVTPLVLEPPVGRKAGRYESGKRSVVWEMVWFNPNNTLPLPVLILDEMPTGLKFSDVQCDAQGASNCTASFNQTLNRIEVTGVIAPDYLAPPDAPEDQLANEIVITLVNNGAAEGFVNYDNRGEGCWDYNNNGSAQDDYDNGQQCIPVTAQVTSGSITVVPVPALSFWVKLMTMMLLLLIGMYVLYGRRESR